MRSNLSLDQSVRNTVHSLDLEGIVKRAHHLMDLEDALRSEQEETFAVGDACDVRGSQPGLVSGSGVVRFGEFGDCPPTPQISGCFRGGQRICDVQHVSQAQVVAGGAAFVMQVEPTNTSWFEPVGVRWTSRDLANSDLPHVTAIGGVDVNTETQEPTFTRPIVLPVIAGDRAAFWWSDIWTAPLSCACDVGWGAFSNLANSNALNISGTAIGLPVTTLSLINITVYGNAWNGQPPMYVGKPTFRRPEKHKHLNIAQCYQYENGVPAGNGMPGSFPMPVPNGQPKTPPMGLSAVPPGRVAG